MTTHSSSRCFATYISADATRSELTKQLEAALLTNNIPQANALARRLGIPPFVERDSYQYVKC